MKQEKQHFLNLFQVCFMGFLKIKIKKNFQILKDTHLGKHKNFLEK